MSVDLMRELHDAPKLKYSPDEYLELEEAATTKSEYVGGVIYPMTGAKNIHNEIVVNVSSLLWNQLQGKPCKVFNSDTKVRIQLLNETRFYYPDVLVTCKPNRAEEVFQDHPKLIVEVLPNSTRRYDEGEKRDAYLQIDSLTYYLLIHPSRLHVELYQRATDGFSHTIFDDVDAGVAFKDIDCELKLTDIYRGTQSVLKTKPRC